MPIQFRCASCQQLLGIAKRKAGSHVDCPNCKKKILVPAVSSNSSVAEPPVRRDRTQPMSIFDRMDVDKLLQKPTKPILVEDEKDGGVALAPPPVRRKVVFHPDPLEAPEPPTVKSDEPGVLQRLDAEEPEPADDEPFPLTPIAITSTSRNALGKVWLSILLLLGGLVVLGAFFAGHWVGSHRPLF